MPDATFDGEVTIMFAHITRKLFVSVLAVVVLVVSGCGAYVAYRPGYVYYDSYGTPYTYQAYGGGYRVAYVNPSYVTYRGGVQVVAPGASYYYQRPAAGVYVQQPRGGVVVNAPPPAYHGGGGVQVQGRGGVVVNGR